MVSKVNEIKSTEHSKLMKALSITFSGPLLFDFALGKKNRTVDIYVPFCPYHEAGFFFSGGSLSEIDLWKGSSTSSKRRPIDLTYKICGSGIKATQSTKLVTSEFPKGPTPVTRTPSHSTHPRGTNKRASSDNAYVLQLGAAKGRAAKTTISPPTYKTMFKLIVPMPQYVSPIYYDFVEVLDTFDASPRDEFLMHCTALRFFYEWDGRSEISLVTASDSYNITPPLFGKLPQMADIEVRYEGVSIADENDVHSDARSCFASLATLAGVEWWVNFGDGLSSPTNPSKPWVTVPDGTRPNPRTGADSTGGMQMVSHTGGDCHALIIVNGLT